ncbi:hypothetical protein PRUPE_6G126000 [Prunus persica]|uniref:Uncharacterized protein n=1 Tax=Prunus persica TaxID=3760 RepID=A0A251NPD2_PRUPE|nr:hypothetical protein PRUPE_6G126000 [Prunus persica]
MKGLWAKKQAKVKRSNSNQVEAEQPQKREEIVFCTLVLIEPTERIENPLKKNNKSSAPLSFNYFSIILHYLTCSVL